MGRHWATVLAFLGLFLLQANATERRVALVMGNSVYEDAPTLANPVNDARDMAARLRGMGFTVVEGYDLGKRDMERTIGDFADALQDASVGLFYYAGHGLGVDSQNFLVPVDAKLDVLLKLRLEAVPLDEVLDIMRSEAKTTLVFLDACSNNPFARETRSVKPLQSFAPIQTSDDSFVAFSTQDGATASDGAGRNSPFAASLLAHIGEPGLSIYDLMQTVRRDVHSATRDAQVPFVKDSLLEPFMFVPVGGQAFVAQVPPKPAAPAEVAGLNRALGDEGSVEDFLRRGYLAPAPGTVDRTVRELYAPKATIFGAPVALDDLVKAKADWFAQWESWALALEPGSLKVASQGRDYVTAVFAMRYDYAPKTPQAARLAGRARVTLGLVRNGGGWLIVSESSEALE